MACPICKNETIEKYRPFCSKRCADVDLYHWLKGNYSLEAIDQNPENNGLLLSEDGVKRHDEIRFDED